jgi:hypothetical protein
LAVKIFNHQGCAAVQFTSPTTREVNWEVSFEPADSYHFPPSAPENVSVQRLGLDGASLTWREQYYLNCGYQVYLNGVLQGYTPMAEFDLRGLDPRRDYEVEVKTVAQDGVESPRAGQARISLAKLAPEHISLAQIEPVRSTGRWQGMEIEDVLPGGTPSVAGETFDRALTAFGNSEVEFDLHGLYSTFTARAGLSANSSSNSVAEFAILGDGKELWRKEEIKLAEPPVGVGIDITGVNKLILRTRNTEPANGRRQRMQVVWGEPLVSKTATKAP